MIRPADNPFRTEKLQQLEYRFGPQSAVTAAGAATVGWRQPESLEETLAALRSRRYRGSLVGGHGTGKSTLLRALEAPLAEAGFTVERMQIQNDRLREDAARLFSLAGRRDSGLVLLADSVELLGWMGLRRLVWRSRKLGGLVVTLHQPGPLPVVRYCQSDYGLLWQLVEQLIGDMEEIPPGQGNTDAGMQMAEKAATRHAAGKILATSESPAGFNKEELAWKVRTLFERHAGNSHEVFRELYLWIMEEATLRK